MTSTKWDSATGEMLIRCDAQTAHEVLVVLQRRNDLPKELVALRDSIAHTIRVTP